MVYQMGSTWGVGNLDKMAENCIKVAKSTFWRQKKTLGGMGGGAGAGAGGKQIFRLVGGIPPVPPGETLWIGLDTRCR